MADIGVTVTGDRGVALRFDQYPAKLHDDLLPRIGSLTSELAARIKAAEPHKTGKLQSDTTTALYDDVGRKISGRVYVDADYAKAGALEYGAHGRAKVSAHSATLDHVFANRLSSPTKVIVAAHSRQTNIAARKFLRGPLAAFSAEIDRSLHEVVNKSIEEANS